MSHDVAFGHDNVLYFTDAGETRLAAERGGGGGAARRGARHPRRGSRGDRSFDEVRRCRGPRFPPSDEAPARASATARTATLGGGGAACRSGSPITMCP